MRPKDHLVEPFLVGIGHEPPAPEHAAGPDAPRRSRRPTPLGRIVAYVLLLVVIGVLVAFQAF